MQALTQKLEDEKIRQRERSQNNRDRSRSKSVTISNIERYSKEIKKERELERSVSPSSSIYSKWKMMPR